MGKVCKKSVFNFNHVSRDLSEDDRKTLEGLYVHYHCKAFCYTTAFKHFTRVNIALSVASMGLTIIGTVVGAFTLNPIILGVVTGSGVILHGILKLKNYDKKIEMCKFAYTNYQSILNKIRSYLRGQDFKIDELIAELNWIDDIVVDLCPVVDKYEIKYDKIYSKT